MILDTYQHFWHYEPNKQAWISDEMAGIRRNFLLYDLKPVLKKIL